MIALIIHPFFSCSLHQVPSHLINKTCNLLRQVGCKAVNLVEYCLELGMRNKLQNGCPVRGNMSAWKMHLSAAAQTKCRTSTIHHHSSHTAAVDVCRCAATAVPDSIACHRSINFHAVSERLSGCKAYIAKRLEKKISDTKASLT